MAKNFGLRKMCRRCRGIGYARNRETYAWEVCPACDGKKVTFRKISYAGPVGRRMLAAERDGLASIRAANKAGHPGGFLGRGVEERLEQKGKIVFLAPIGHLRGGYMLAGWRKPIERSYYGEYGTKLWSPVTKKLIRRKKIG